MSRTERDRRAYKDLLRDYLTLKTRFQRIDRLYRFSQKLMDETKNNPQAFAQACARHAGIRMCRDGLRGKGPMIFRMITDAYGWRDY